ncbi:MAG: DnaJ C-terminal domain-containing protein, partial [Coriobacteriaceae bacterium]|nr:DnaJ C-terminal domain-containing protein [Coriobacteriaceae bacterium]
MHNVITVTDFEDPRLDAFARLTEAQLRSRIEPDKYFERDGDNLHCRATVSVAQACLGATIKVQGILP